MGVSIVNKIGVRLDPPIKSEDDRVPEIATSSPTLKLRRNPRNDGGETDHNDEEKKLSWRGDSSVQKLLDVVSSIIAQEYIEVAKKNKDVFMDSPVKPENDSGRKELK